MNTNRQSNLQLHNLSARQYPKLSKPVIWAIRMALLGLVALWVAGGLYLNNQVKQDEQRIEQARLEVQRQEARARRLAQYEQDVQQRTKAPQTRNAFDGK